LGPGEWLVDPSKLVKGQIYFWYGFADSALTVPLITTLQYVGKNLSSSKVGEDHYLFGDPAEERERQNTGYSGPRKSENIVPESSMGYVCDFDGLLGVLSSARSRMK
jgi:hypothetical protein